MKALWNNTIIAEGDTVFFDNNHYFPKSALHMQYFKASSETSVCPWKGTASYFDVVVGGDENQGCAWYYPEPLADAAAIKDHVAFWRGIKVEED